MRYKRKSRETLVPSHKVATGVRLRRNGVLRGRKSELRFRDLVEPALEAKQLRGNEASSIRTDRVRLRRILSAIGHLKIRQLAAGRIERFLQDLARGDKSHSELKGATINRFHSLLSSIFRYAVRHGFLGSNPMAGGSVPRSKESPIHVRYLGRMSNVAACGDSPRFPRESSRGRARDPFWNASRRTVHRQVGGLEESRGNSVRHRKDWSAGRTDKSSCSSLPHAAKKAGAARADFHHTRAQ